jgi:cytochrome c-type biogenesis protein CcsB
MILQNSLANYSFLTLLGSMIFYWIETSFAGINLVRLLGFGALRSNEEKEPPSVQARSLWEKESSVRSSLLFPKGEERAGKATKEPPQSESVLLVPKKQTGSVLGSLHPFLRTAEFILKFLTNNNSIAKYGIFISNILLGLLLLLRWKESGHFPLSNLYESLMFLSWCFTGLHLYIDNYTSLPTSLQKENNEFVRKLIGAITTPSALLTNAFATFTLPKEMQEIAPLVPALQSNWLMMHVTVMILSYAALILGSLMSIAFLIVTAVGTTPSSEKESSKENSFFFGLTNPKKETANQYTTNNASVSSGCFAEGPVLSPAFSAPLERRAIREKEPEHKNSTIAITLDNLSYRILGIGFPLLTIGILSGAVWANEAWGSYWSWDPKETWALLTWLIFAIYLHTRLSKGWEGKKPALIASFGFLIVWMCYLGVNLLGEGLHSYGWIVQS